MRLLFKQRMFSWFDSYDIYDEAGNTVFYVKGAMAWGHLLRIYDTNDREVGRIQQKVFSFLPCFELYAGDTLLGTIRKEFSWFRPHFSMDFNGWQVDGTWWEWDYNIRDAYGGLVAIISKEAFQWTDTYAIDVYNKENAVYALMVVLAIDAEKCSRG